MTNADEGDLFDVSPVQLDPVPRVSDEAEPRITLSAHKLAVMFTEDADLPARFRSSSVGAPPRKIDEDAENEKRFRARVQCWVDMIRAMLERLPARQAWRFIDCSPEIGAGERGLVRCRDFQDFIDYVIRRRDQEQCPDDECGRLALLVTAFQREAELRMSTSENSAPQG